MTLIEVIVAIAIFTIGIEGFSLLFINTWRHNKYTLEMGQSSMVVSQGVTKIANYLRGVRQADNGSYPVRSADDNDLVVYCDYDKDGKTERLHFYKSGTNVLMGIREPNNDFPVTYSSGDEETQTMAGSIMNTTSDPIFEYYDQSYTGTQSPLSTPAVVANIRMVRIHLMINIDPNNAPDNVNIETFVGLRNLSDYDRIE